MTTAPDLRPQLTLTARKLIVLASWTAIEERTHPEAASDNT